MLKLKTLFIQFILICTFHSLLATEGKIVRANGIDIWYETFGHKEDPALLMIMGGCCQGILWPTELCEQLAHEGFYVIRYDHRDTGFSTGFDFDKQPYDYLDMAKDAVSLLDAIGVEKANLLGLSMGGPIAELMSVHFPHKVSTITIMATSCDFRPLHLALDGFPSEEGSLSPPRDFYLKWINNLLKERPPVTEEGKLAQRVEGWRMLNGSIVPFEEKRYRELHQEFLDRLKHPEGINNHVLASKRSEDLVRTVPSQVKVPTLIFHGSEDPILPPDHGAALTRAIPSSTYILLEGMGHVPNCYFYDRIIKEVKLHAAKAISPH